MTSDFQTFPGMQLHMLIKVLHVDNKGLAQRYSMCFCLGTSEHFMFFAVINMQQSGQEQLSNPAMIHSAAGNPHLPLFLLMFDNIKSCLANGKTEITQSPAL